MGLKDHGSNSLDRFTDENLFNSISRDDLSFQFTRSNLKIVHIVCHDKQEHLTKKCDPKFFYCVKPETESKSSSVTQKVTKRRDVAAKRRSKTTLDVVVDLKSESPKTSETRKRKIDSQKDRQSEWLTERERRKKQKAREKEREIQKETK